MPKQRSRRYIVGWRLLSNSETWRRPQRGISAPTWMHWARDTPR